MKTRVVANPGAQRLVKSSAGREVTRVGSVRWAILEAGCVEIPCGLGEAGHSQGSVERRGRPSCSCVQVESRKPAAGQGSFQMSQFLSAPCSLQRKARWAEHSTLHRAGLCPHGRIKWVEQWPWKRRSPLRPDNGRGALDHTSGHRLLYMPLPFKSAAALAPL